MGSVGGITTRYRNCGAALYPMVFTSMEEARERATKRMRGEASKLGADTVINVRFTTSQVMQGMSEILAYGTAVRAS